MSRAAVEGIAVLLEPILDQLVLVGGCATAFLVPSPNDRVLRPTDDVDYIIPAFSYGEVAEWENRLRELGFVNCREDGVICRWMIGATRVDFMPVDGRALGFSNRWYHEAVREPCVFPLANGLQVRVVNIPAFLATKFDAFSDRGEGDFLANSDIEDIMTILAFRPDSADLIAGAAPELRQYLSEQAAQLLARGNLRDIIAGCFDANHQTLVPHVHSRLQDFLLTDLAARLGLKIAEIKAIRAPQLTKALPDGGYEPIAFHVALELQQALRRKHKLEGEVELGQGLHAAGVITQEQADWLDEIRRSLVQGNRGRPGRADE